MQVRVHGALGDAEHGCDLGGLHPVLPSHQRDLLLPRRHLPDDRPRPFQRDRAQRLRCGVGRDGLVPGLDVGLPAAERLLAAEIADVLVRQRAEQPRPLPVLGMPAQRRPGPRRRLERVLHQVRGELAVTAGPHARVAEQPSVVRREEGAQLGHVTLRDPGLIAIVHAVPPPAGPGLSSPRAS
jgi:hypothetical protein